MADAQQMAQAQEMLQIVQADMGVLCNAVKPSESEPNKPITIAQMIAALVSVPSLADVGEEQVETVQMVVDVLKKHGALDEEALSGLEGPSRRNAVLLYWKLNRQREGLEDEVKLDETSDEQASNLLRMVTKLLLQAQMLMPQQRWVQQTLAVARTSALVANSLWSHTDPAAIALQEGVLKEDGLPYPKVALKATVHPKTEGDAAAEEEEATACEVLPGAQVVVRVTLDRNHAGPSENAKQLTRQGVLEAYWLYLEGVKPQQSLPNSLISAQPMVVKDLEMPKLEAAVAFQAPPAVGSYKLVVHVVSTSIIGIDLEQTCEFAVIEDDVPPLA